jgi:hypothetical protein
VLPIAQRSLVLGTANTRPGALSALSLAAGEPVGLTVTTNLPREQ